MHYIFFFPYLLLCLFALTSAQTSAHAAEEYFPDMNKLSPSFHLTDQQKLKDYRAISKDTLQRLTELVKYERFKKDNNARWEELCEKGMEATDSARRYYTDKYKEEARDASVMAWLNREHTQWTWICSAYFERFVNHNHLAELIEQIEYEIKENAEVEKMVKEWTKDTREALEVLSRPVVDQVIQRTTGCDSISSKTLLDAIEYLKVVKPWLGTKFDKYRLASRVLDEKWKGYEHFLHFLQEVGIDDLREAIYNPQYADTSKSPVFNARFKTWNEEVRERAEDLKESTLKYAKATSNIRERKISDDFGEIDKLPYDKWRDYLSRWRDDVREAIKAVEECEL